MGIENFRTVDKPTAIRGKIVSESPGGGKHQLLSDDEQMRKAKNEIVQWLKQNSDRKYVRNKDVAGDIELEHREITLVLNKLDEVTRWSSKTTPNPKFLNPYYSEK